VNWPLTTGAAEVSQGCAAALSNRTAREKPTATTAANRTDTKQEVHTNAKANTLELTVARDVQREMMPPNHAAAH
jgi:hypothetical protein